jgi:hypothetical protein
VTYAEADIAARLTIELVPRTCWFSNVRDRVSREDWDRIRKQTYAHADLRCEVCGGRGSKHPVECHEVWEYESAGVQCLIRMIALCPACHEVKHIGLAELKGRREIAAGHLAKVNGWTAPVADKYIEKAFATWDMQSDRTWSLDISALDIYGIDPAVIADASRAPAESRSRSAVSVTAEVRRAQ